MWKQRIIAIVLLAAAAGIGFLVYRTEMNKSKTFHLGLDLSGGTHLVYNADVSNIPPSEVSESLGVLREVIERRVNSLGISEATVANETSVLGGTKEYRLVVDMPGITDVQKALDIIGQTPVLEFKVENPKYDPKNPPKELEVTDDMIKNGQIDLSAALDQISPYISTGLTGQYLQHATLQFNQTTGQSIVGIQFNEEGSKRFAEITKANVGKTIAVYLDGAIISAPVVNEEITGGDAVINGNFTPQEAQQLVSRLNSGALPVPVKLVSTESIGPTLGADALRAGLHAGLIGLIAIMILLIVWYRLPGFVASVALLIYTVISLFLFKYIPVTLTSAGIAGFIISIGMAVDANILIFERMKEEIKSGKGLKESITEGFERAWTSIRDGNISSIISAIILFLFGTTLIKGFAIVFGLGVFVSMLTALSISRVFLRAVAGNNAGRVKKFLFSSGLSK
jgi:protein-export membrane protein SecD